MKRLAFPERCSCCGSPIRSTREWRKLAYVGVQRLGEYGLPDLELRNHACGSTLAAQVSA